MHSLIIGWRGEQQLRDAGEPDSVGDNPGGSSRGGSVLAPAHEQQLRHAAAAKDERERLSDLVETMAREKRGADVALQMVGAASFSRAVSPAPVSSHTSILLPTHTHI